MHWIFVEDTISRVSRHNEICPFLKNVQAIYLRFGIFLSIECFFGQVTCVLIVFPYRVAEFCKNPL